MVNLVEKESNNWFLTIIALALLILMGIGVRGGLLPKENRNTTDILDEGIL
mgnify:CR=1 FL=1